jgi:nitrogen regulatory protein PII 2
MKEVMAIIRFNKINATKRALADAGFYLFNTYKTLGRGKGSVDYWLLEGAEKATKRLYPAGARR